MAPPITGPQIVPFSPFSQAFHISTHIHTHTNTQTHHVYVTEGRRAQTLAFIHSPSAEYGKQPLKHNTTSCKHQTIHHIPSIDSASLLQNPFVKSASEVFAPFKGCLSANTTATRHYTISSNSTKNMRYASMLIRNIRPYRLLSGIDSCSSCEKKCGYENMRVSMQEARISARFLARILCLTTVE